MDRLARTAEGPLAHRLPPFAQFDGIGQQVHHGLDVVLDAVWRQLFAKLVQLPQQVRQAPLLAAVQAVVGGIEIRHQDARQRVAQGLLDDLAAAAVVDQVDGQFGVGKAPRPDVFAVDPPARLVRVHHRRLPQKLQELLHDGIEQRRAPPQVPQRAGTAQVQPKQLVQQGRGLAQRNAQMRAGVAIEQPHPRPDVRARQLQVAAALAGRLAVFAAADVPPIPVHFDLRLGNVFLIVIFELAGPFQLRAPAHGTVLRLDVVMDDVLFRHFREVDLPLRTGMLAMLLRPPVNAGLGLRLRVGLGTVVLAPPLQLRLQLLDPRIALRQLLPQIGDQRLQLLNPLL